MSYRCTRQWGLPRGVRGAQDFVMDRTFLTPGKLYVRLSAEFRTLRPDSCTSCSVPLPLVVERASPDFANWELGAVPSVCDACRITIEEVVGRALEHYDVCDPTVSPARRRH
jgi:hypothetical protein